MRRLALAIVTVLAMTACGSPSASESQPSESASAELMAAALTELVATDHTFGAGPPPFTQYLIEENTVPISLPPTPDSPDSVQKSSDTRRSLSEMERSAIETAIAEYGAVRWIEDPDDWRIDLEPKVEGSVILGVDAPILDGAGALVPVSLWCGGDCGTWFTYRLALIDDTWQVTGQEGPVSIS